VFLKNGRGFCGFFVLCIVQCFSVGAVCRRHGVPLYAVFAVHFLRFWFIGV